jgi:mono/diheme cytochrome c family protein
MYMRKQLIPSLLVLSIISGVLYSCSKSGGDDPAPDPCAGVTVSITGTITDAASGQSNGAITASATGGSGFTYRLGNGSFQSSGTFSNLAAGTYTITARNSDGCEGSNTFTVSTLVSCTTPITVAATATNATPCLSTANGTITVTASGGSGLTYSINGSTFQSGNVFNNVAAGNYTVTVKNASNCSQKASVTVGAAPAGTLFASVKSILQTNCVSCHNASNTQGGMNWTVDCNIVSNSARIKARAVDAHGTSNQMPPPPNAGLSAADRQKITDWIAAGGRYTD